MGHVIHGWPIMACCLFLQIKFYWNSHVHSFTYYLGCCRAIMAEVGSCNSDQMDCEA